MRKASQTLLYLVLALGSFVWLVKVPILIHYLSEELGTPVSLAWVSIWPTETTMHRFMIEGPENKRSASLLKADKVVCRYLWSKGTVDIRDLEFDGVTIFIEPVSGKSNWEAVLAEVHPAQDVVPVQVRQCTMNHVLIEIRGSDGRFSKYLIDSFKVRDLYGKTGFPIREFLQAIQSAIHE